MMRIVIKNKVVELTVLKDGVPYGGVSVGHGIDTYESNGELRIHLNLRYDSAIIGASILDSTGGVGSWENVTSQEVVNYTITGKLLESNSEPKKTQLRREKVVYVDKVTILPSNYVDPSKIVPIQIIKKRGCCCEN